VQLDSTSATRSAVDRVVSILFSARIAFLAPAVPLALALYFTPEWRAARDPPTPAVSLIPTRAAPVAFGPDEDAWPPSAKEEMARRLGARVTVVHGAGHSPAADRPAETAAALVEFWATT